MPVFSVIVPIYNGEKFIHKCVDSILLQTFSDFELILVDDGSTDRCPKICDEYSAKDSRVKVIHQANQGVSVARNTGLAAATGEYVAFCDGDDYYKDTLLERTYSIAKDNNAEVVSYKLKRISDNEQQSEDETLQLDVVDLSGEKRFDLLYKVVTWQTKGWQACRSIFKRKIIEEHNIKFCDTCGNFAEDLGFTLEYLLYNSRIVFLDEYLYYYYDVRQNSMMNRSRKVYKINEVNELSYYLRPMMTKVISDEQFSVIHHHIIMNQVVDLYSANSKQELREWHQLITEIDNVDYFKTENQNYYKNYKKEKGLYGARGIKRYLFSKTAIINRYLCGLNLNCLFSDLRLNGLLKR